MHLIRVSACEFVLLFMIENVTNHLELETNASTTQGPGDPVPQDVPGDNAAPFRIHEIGSSVRNAVELFFTNNPAGCLPCGARSRI